MLVELTPVSSTTPIDDKSLTESASNRIAVIVGVGQVRRRPELDGPWEPIEPANLMAQAIDKAIDDAAAHGAGDSEQIRATVTALACVDPLGWGYTDLCASTASSAGLAGVTQTFIWPPGGNSPGDLLHEVANSIADGLLDVAVLTGSEVVYSLRRARKEGVDLKEHWTPFPGHRDFLKGQRPLTTPTEVRHGMVAPIHCYPMYENAIRAKAGRTIEEHQQHVSELMARNSAVAATNPYAWFPTALTAAEIATVDPGNRWVSFPYPKRMNAIMEVDQSAALLIMSQAEADRRGIAREYQVQFLGGASCTDAWTPIERADLAESPAIAAAATAAFEQAGVELGEVDLIDLYSCFPSAVQMAMRAIGIEDNDARGVTLTGGLAYAGGPGNSYALHSMCVAVERIRGGEGNVALVSSLGMTATKHAISLLGGHAVRSGTQRVGTHRGVKVKLSKEALEGPEVVDCVSGEGHVVSYTIEYGRDGAPIRSMFIVLLDDGRRTVGNGSLSDDEVRALTASEGVGRRVFVEAGTPDIDGEPGQLNKVTLR